MDMVFLSIRLYVRVKFYAYSRTLTNFNKLLSLADSIFWAGKTPRRHADAFYSPLLKYLHLSYIFTIQMKQENRMGERTRL